MAMEDEKAIQRFMLSTVAQIAKLLCLLTLSLAGLVACSNRVIETGNNADDVKQGDEFHQESLTEDAATISNGDLIAITVQERSDSRYPDHVEIERRLILLDTSTGTSYMPADRLNVDITYSAWSHDGKQLSFVAASGPDGKQELYVMGASGTEAKTIVSEPECSVHDSSWSPDDEQIVFSMSCGDSGTSPLFVVDVDGNNRRQLTEDGSYDEQPAWSPLGTLIAFNTLEGEDVEVALYDLITDEISILTNNTEHDWSPSWSPDGRWITFETFLNGQQDIVALNLETKRLVNLTDSPSIEMEASWSSDGRQIYFVSDRNNLKGSFDLFRLDLEDGTSYEVLDTSGSYWFPKVQPKEVEHVENIDVILHTYRLVNSTSLSPSGIIISGEIVYGCSNSALCSISLDTWESRNYISNPNLEVDTFSISPDNKKLVYECADSDDLCLIDLETQEMVQLTKESFGVANPSWSPDSQLIAFSSSREGGNNIYTVNSNGTELKRVTDYWGGARWPTWAPDGQWIAFIGSTAHDHSDSSVFAVNIITGHTIQLIDMTGNIIGPIAWSYDGTKIAYSYRVISERDPWDFFPIMVSSLVEGTTVKVFTFQAWRNNEFSIPKYYWTPEGKLLIAYSLDESISSDQPTLYAISENSTVVLVAMTSPNYFYWTGAESSRGGLGTIGIKVDLSRFSLVADDGSEQIYPELANYSGIAFFSERNNSQDLFYISGGGRDLVQLAQNETGKVSWSPDGTSLLVQDTGYFGSGSALYRVDPLNGVRQLILDQEQLADVLGDPQANLSFAHLIGWTSKTTVLYGLSTGITANEICEETLDNALLFEVDILSKSVRAVRVLCDIDSGSIALSPDGKEISYGKPGLSMTILKEDLDGSKTLKLLELPGIEIEMPITDADIAWSPDGQFIAIASTFYEDAKTWLVELSTGTVNFIDAVAVNWSPDGQWLAGSSRIVSADGSRMLSGDYGYAQSWSPDSRWLAYSSDGDIFALDVRTNRTIRLIDHPAADWEPIWQPLDQ